MSDEKLTDKLENLNVDIAEIKKQLEGKKKKSMGMNFFFKTRLGRAKLKKGYIIVFKIDDNKHIDVRREPIVEGVVKLNDTYHAVDELDIFYYKNKPCIIQPKKKLNPYNPLYGDNETYGQSYVMATMLRDAIKEKKDMKIMGVILVVLVVAGIAYYFYSNGGI